MRILKLFASLLAGLCLATSAVAYLATTNEIALFWDRERSIPNEVYVRYESAESPAQILEIYVRTDGLWAKRVMTGDSVQREVWKWGLDTWQMRQGVWKKSPRRQATWEDWLFEPRVDVLLQLTSNEYFAVSGLGKHKEGYAWIYGARHDLDAGPWFSLLRDPIRLGAWTSSNEDIGKIELAYAPKEFYPKQIVFERQHRAAYRLSRQALNWRNLPARGFEKPDEITLEPARMPVRPALDASENPNR